MLTLGIESSCDETSAAIVAEGRRVLANVVATQEDLHVPYGGVVPEIACRAHLVEMVPAIRKALRDAGAELDDVDGVAVVHRPGLIGSLLVGLTTAKTLAWALDKPLVGVEHILAHLYAAALDCDDDIYPAVGLVVSGGHTSLYRCRSPIDTELLGSTTDDAAGEAFDKVAKLLGLGYPGGPVIDRMARDGDRTAHDFPRPFLAPDSFDFSFSGLKTAVLYKCKGQPPGRGKAPEPGRWEGGGLSEREVADMAASFQEAVVDVLVGKAVGACKRTGEERLIIGGGVACNSRLRERLEEACGENRIRLHLPPRKYCPDNAAMVAGLGYHLLRAGRTADLALDAAPR